MRTCARDGDENDTGTVRQSSEDVAEMVRATSRPSAASDAPHPSPAAAAAASSVCNPRVRSNGIIVEHLAPAVNTDYLR